MEYNEVKHIRALLQSTRTQQEKNSFFFLLFPFCFSLYAAYSHFMHKNKVKTTTCNRVNLCTKEHKNTYLFMEIKTEPCKEWKKISIKELYRNSQKNRGTHISAERTRIHYTHAYGSKVIKLKWLIRKTSEAKKLGNKI